MSEQRQFTDLDDLTQDLHRLVADANRTAGELLAAARWLQTEYREGRIYLPTDQANAMASILGPDDGPPEQVMLGIIGRAATNVQDSNPVMTLAHVLLSGAATFRPTATG